MRNIISKNLSKQFGFTLTEIMITVAILGVIAAIAIPNYQQYVTRTNRVDAMNALMRISAEQEKYYLENNSYMDSSEFATQNTAKKWFPSNSDGIFTENGYYQLSIDDVDPDADPSDPATPTFDFNATFTAIATPVSGGVQANDSDCKTFTIDGAGQRVAKNSGGTTNAKCWK